MNYLKVMIKVVIVVVLSSSCSQQISYKNEHLSKNQNDYSIYLPTKAWALKINNKNGNLRTFYYSKFHYIEFYDTNWYFRIRYSNDVQYKIKNPMNYFRETESSNYNPICFGTKQDYKYMPSFIFKGGKDSCYVADYFQPEWDEMGIRARKLIAIMEYDGVIMDIEISKIFYQDSDAVEFQRILNSIEFVELKQE